MEGGDKEQERSSRDAFLKITLHVLRKMKQDESAERLQSSKRILIDLTRWINRTFTTTTTPYTVLQQSCLVLLCCLGFCCRFPSLTFCTFPCLFFSNLPCIKSYQPCLPSVLPQPSAPTCSFSQLTYFLISSSVHLPVFASMLLLLTHVVIHCVF